VSGAWDRPFERAARLLLGLVLFGVALAALVKSRLGLDPWTVFNQGVAEHVGLTIGQVTVIGSLLLLAAWIPLRQRPGLGTIANALIVGPVLDLGLRWIPAPSGIAGQVAYMVAAIAGAAVATGLYVGAGWGPGPRDGLMTGFAALGAPIAVARASIEVTVLIAGWCLGGTVGVATVFFATTIGPLVKLALRRLALPAELADLPDDGRLDAAGGVGEARQPWKPCCAASTESSVRSPG
jgi:uncharacterized membrane protein YczE